MEWELAQRVRRVRAVLSDRAGRMVTMADTVTALLDRWDDTERDRPPA